MASTQTALIGVPLDLGAENLGVDTGPKAFRHQHIVKKLNQIGLNIEDLGNIACLERQDIETGSLNLRYMNEIIRVNEILAKITQKAIKNNHKVIVMGGDHSVNLGAMSGASTATKGDIGLIYLDAHGDMNTDKTTLTGNIHGMHLAALLGHGDPKLVNLHNNQIKLAKENLLHIGGSDFDKAELDFIIQEKLQTFTLLDLLSQNLSPLLKMIDNLATRVNNIWISLDLDVIDRIYAPGAGMPNAKGLTYREIATIAEYIGKRCHVIGVDIVEYNPLQDEQNKTAELGIELIAKFLGKNYSWYTNYLAINNLSRH